MHRSQCALFGALLSFLAGWPAIGRGEEAKPTPFLVGQSAPSNTFLAIWMAQAEEFYRAQGLAVDILPMTGGSDSGPALSSGRIQIMHIGMSSVVRANAAGSNLRTVASLSNVIRLTFFTRKNVKTAADLKGGTVGITSVGSETDATMGLALARVGLKREDVTVREVGGRRLPALVDGEISATLLSEPERTQAFALGLNPMVDLLKDQTPWIFTGLVVDSGYLKSNRGDVLKFLKATAEGNYKALADPARAKQVLAKELRISDAGVLDQVYENFRQQTPRNIEISKAGADNIITNVAAATAAHKYEDYVDESLLAELTKAGFFDQLQAKYKMAPR